MSGGKRNHEDVSDTMALVQAACKVLAITARPLAHFRHRRQPVRSAIGAAAKPRANGAERHVSRERLLCVAAASNRWGRRSAPVGPLGADLRVAPC